MKVLHACDSIVGGTGSYLAELLPHQLDLLGIDNVLLIMPKEHLAYLDPNLIDRGLKIELFKRRSRFVGLFHLLIKFFAVNRRFKPDIVHAHSSGAGALLRTVRRMIRGRLIFCSHGWAFDIPAKPTTRHIIQWIERALAYRADRIVAISQHEYDRAIEIGIPASKLVLIYNGVSRSPPIAVRAQWDDHRLKILFVGRFDRQKGLDLLLEAIEPLGETVTLRAIGEPVVTANYNPMVALPFVEYYGWRTRGDVAAQMMAADVLIMPSRWEGFGLAAIEAMRMSLPVAASSVGGLREIIRDGQFGFVFPPNDVLALRACIQGLTGPALAAMRVAGHRRFLDCFTADRMVAEIDMLYREVLTESGQEKASRIPATSEVMTPELSNKTGR
ncbi:glycosyltransferase family 4 protein [soil metagenome]